MEKYVYIVVYGKGKDKTIRVFEDEKAAERYYAGCYLFPHERQWIKAKFIPYDPTLPVDDESQTM